MQMLRCTGDTVLLPPGDHHQDHEQHPGVFGKVKESQSGSEIGSHVGPPVERLHST
ncbi:hypothetical protein GCM10010246_57250 [Streptomyces cuspidosporus]|uniref:Uncharacterized protein n=1 Tax=Streptomyces cuspidosporus TaxID=66882 RepID=A0ABN3GS35_9ACTN